ncbi:hypothetical protein NE237_007316 [Protea cynaroides]|uniref:Uncharacterized protein n=1 Tax=Protea cynaroides TaxID=273540 RepID=A0A9Q0QWA0_9MAGN|nr:hypothetical protein NE237_007316 [Protea cynaroides]
MKLSEGKDTSNMSWMARWHAETKFEDGKTSQVVDFSDPFALPNLLDALDRDKYGNVTRDIEELCARKMQLLNPLFARYPFIQRTVYNEDIDDFIHFNGVYIVISFNWLNVFLGSESVALKLCLSWLVCKFINSIMQCGKNYGNPSYQT